MFLHSQVSGMAKRAFNKK